jgi:hypothetical protein
MQLLPTQQLVWFSSKKKPPFEFRWCFSPYLWNWSAVLLGEKTRIQLICCAWNQHINTSIQGKDTSSFEAAVFLPLTPLVEWVKRLGPIGISVCLRFESVKRRVCLFFLCFFREKFVLLSFPHPKPSPLQFWHHPPPHPLTPNLRPRKRERCLRFRGLDHFGKESAKIQVSLKPLCFCRWLL